ncbi:MAG: hypothetical protein KHZ62_03285 [Clostridiales bacterium]|nr:hypothetical protein [Clostridiales bacterium]
MDKIIEMYQSLSFWDVAYCAVMAFVMMKLLTQIMQIKVIRVKNGQDGMRTISVNYSDLEQRCINLFPIDTVTFDGESFTRGMKIRVTTFQEKVFEGRLIGKNNKNVICVLNGHNIIAHSLNKISHIDFIESKPKVNQ